MQTREQNNNEEWKLVLGSPGGQSHDFIWKLSLLCKVMKWKCFVLSLLPLPPSSQIIIITFITLIIINWFLKCEFKKVCWISLAALSKPQGKKYTTAWRQLFVILEFTVKLPLPRRRNTAVYELEKYGIYYHFMASFPPDFYCSLFILFLNWKAGMCVLPGVHTQYGKYSVHTAV